MGCSGQPPPFSLQALEGSDLAGVGDVVDHDRYQRFGARLGLAVDVDYRVEIGVVQRRQVASSALLHRPGVGEEGSGAERVQIDITPIMPTEGERGNADLLGPLPGLPK